VRDPVHTRTLHPARTPTPHPRPTSPRSSGSLEIGTTYNAYLIVGDKVALVDASHEKFHDQFLEALEAKLKAVGACTLGGAGCGWSLHG